MGLGGGVGLYRYCLTSQARPGLGGLICMGRASTHDTLTMMGVICMKLMHKGM